MGPGETGTMAREPGPGGWRVPFGAEVLPVLGECSADTAARLAGGQPHLLVHDGRPVGVVLDLESVIGWEDSLGEDQ